jgi:hypothetical protein
MNILKDYFLFALFCIGGIGGIGAVYGIFVIIEDGIAMLFFMGGLWV